jgi:hypothetical protein
LLFGVAPEHCEHLPAGLLGQGRGHPNKPRRSSGISKVGVSEFLIGPIARYTIFFSHGRRTAGCCRKFPRNPNMRSMVSGFPGRSQC